MRYSERTDRLAPSATLAVAEKIDDLIRKGKNPISFSLGEPDFVTPQHIREAAIKAIKDGQVGMVPNPGLMQLREAIAEDLATRKELDIKPSQVLISNGSKQSIMNAILALVNKGDEVLIPVPAWVSYPEQVKLADGIPIFVPTNEKNGFAVDPDILETFITKKTKLLILNNPNNPSGCIMDRDELLAIAELAARRGIYVICDEIYERLIYTDNPHCSMISLINTIKELTVVTNGFSKTYAMTGWRVGYAVASIEIIKRMAGIQSHCTSGGNHIAQRAALAALKGSQDCVKDMRLKYQERRDYLLERLQRISGFVCPKVEATFYVFPQVSGLFGRKVEDQQINSSVDLVELFIDKIEVGVVPGVAFGKEGYVRISYACDIREIEEGMNRIENLLGTKTNK